MRSQEIYGLIGVVLGVTGLILFILWIDDLVPFLRFSISVALMVGGIWAIGRAAGVAWGPMFAPIARGFREATRGLTVSVGASASPWRCPSCNRPVQPEWQFCLHCGRPLGWRKCPQCGRVQLTEGAFCGFCGARLEEAAGPSA